jgi:hypothetical protein
MPTLISTLLICFLGLSGVTPLFGGELPQGLPADFTFPPSHESYVDLEAEAAAAAGRSLSLFEVLKLRAAAAPFSLVATCIFFAAVAHTFLTGRFTRLAHRFEQEHRNQIGGQEYNHVEGKEPVSFRATLFHFLGEVEVIFGIWTIPLLLAMVFMHPAGPAVTSYYIDTRNFTEPIFVIVIMAIAASRPVIQFAETSLRAVARMGGTGVGAWWLSILIIGPLLGSFITEPAAMTIAAVLLGQQFYQLNPSASLKYATLGLLFVNVSVGGTLTHFASPPILMISSAWNWNMPFMLTHFGWRAVSGVLISSLLYYLYFRKEFARLGAIRASQQTTEPIELKPEPVPTWIILIHLAFIGWTVLTLHHPAFFIGGFLFFIAFTVATHHHQYEIQLRTPLLVGFFLASLVVHGGLQGWWIAPVLGALSEVPLFLGATVLTAFNDNAAITFLASQVPAFSPSVLHEGLWIAKTGKLLTQTQGLEYAVVAGAVTGGGLTVIANAPNPAGQSLLSPYFEGGVSALKLLLAALIPTVIMGILFMALPH